MIWFTLIFIAVSVVLVALRIVLEEYWLENELGYWLECIVASLVVVVHHFWLFHLSQFGDMVFLQSLTLSVVYWMLSNIMAYLSRSLFGYNDDISQLSPYWILLIFLASVLWFIPTEGVRLLGFPNLFDNFGTVVISVVLAEIVLTTFHVWLYIDWDWDKGAHILHWGLAFALVLACFSFFSAHQPNRSLTWLMTVIICGMLLLQRIFVFTWLSFGWEILPIQRSWYSQELCMLGIQVLVVSLMYIMPSLIKALQWIVP